MLNRELKTIDGQTIYPEYVTQDERISLYQKYGEQTEYMYCCCRPDAKLFYRVSKDFRIYPEHQGYIHDPFCVFALRNEGKNHLGYDIDPEHGYINVNFKFKVNTFTPPQKTNAGSSVGVPSDGPEPGQNFKLSLSNFIHDLFADVFNERASQGKSPLSGDYFLMSVFSRLKQVYVNGIPKKLRECTLDDDGFQFFLFKYHGFSVKEAEKPNGEVRKTYYLNVISKDGNEYKWFTYDKLYERANNDFIKAYGVSLADIDEGNVYVAGFRYKVRKYQSIETYNAVGRLTAFVVSDNGLHCRNYVEKINLNTILKKARNAPGKYFVGGTDDFYDGYFVSDDNKRAVIVSDPPKGINEDYRIISRSITKNTLSDAELGQLLFKN